MSKIQSTTGGNEQRSRLGMGFALLCCAGLRHPQVRVMAFVPRLFK